MSVWDPYRPSPRVRGGWKVGPAEVQLGVASGGGACLPVELRIDQAVQLGVAAGAGAGLPVDVYTADHADSSTTLLPAAGAGACLPVELRIDQPTTLGLAAAGGACLVPTLSVVNPVGMFGASSVSSTGGAVSPITRSTTHTRDANDTYAFVFAFFEGVDSTALSGYTRSATYGGVSMTDMGSVDMGTGRNRSWLQVWQLASPASGAQTVSVTATKSGTFSWGQMICVTYGNIGSVGSLLTNTATSGNAAHTVSSASGRRIVQAFASDGTLGTYNQTQRATDGQFMRVGDAPGAASVSFSATASAFWGSLAFELLP